MTTSQLEHIKRIDAHLPDPLAEAVKRMEAVPEADLIAAYIKRGVNHIRARLIQAAKGEQP